MYAYSVNDPQISHNIPDTEVTDSSSAWLEFEILAAVVSRYESADFAGEKSIAPEHRISCHRCGNIRKRRVLCPKSTCPHTFCGRCAEKLKEEHGSSVFMDGCPVCKELCCCSNKSVYCHRKNHCYRKCPSTRSSSYTLQKQQDHHHHHQPDYDSDSNPAGKSALRSTERFDSSEEAEATTHTGIFDLLAAVADGVFEQRSFVEGTTVPAVRVAKSTTSLNNAQALKVACSHRATSANRKKPKLSKQDVATGGGSGSAAAAGFDPSLLHHYSRPPPAKGYYPPSMRNSSNTSSSSSSSMHHTTNSFAPGLGNYNSYSTAAAFNGDSCTAGYSNYNPYHSSSSSTVSSFLHLPEPIALSCYPPPPPPPVMRDHYCISSQKRTAPTDGAPAGRLQLLAEEESSERSTSATAIDSILSLSMDNNNNNSSIKSRSLPYHHHQQQQSLQHLLGGGGMFELAVMPVDCGFDGYTGALLQPSIDGGAIATGESYSYTMQQQQQPLAVRSALVGLDPPSRHHSTGSPTPQLSSTLSYSTQDQSRDAKSVDHHLLLGVTKSPFLQPSCAAHNMDASSSMLQHGMHFTNSFQLAHNSSRDMQLPSIPNMMRSKAVSSLHHSLQGGRTSSVDQRQMMIANALIPVPNATTDALSIIENSSLSIEATSSAHEQHEQQQLQLLLSSSPSSSSSSSRLSAAAIDDTAHLCPMTLLALVSSFSKALDRPALVENDAD